MIRTLPMLKTMITLAAVSLLAGCVTGDYANRNGGRGDYYYGQPSTEYRYYGYGSYGGGYPYGYGSPYGFGSRYGYGYPYGYGGYPYYPYHGGHHGYPYYRPRPPYVIRPPRPDGNNPPSQDRPDGRPPWRDLEQLRRRQQADGGNIQPRSMEQPRRLEPARPIAEPRRESGSPRGQMIRRSAEGRGNREQEP